jgi:hypothetical protein
MNFVQKAYDEYGGILTRLLGGIRGENVNKISNILINNEILLLKNKLIEPYCYRFVGTRLTN